MTSDTPLCAEIKADIARDGPMALSCYMERCLYDATHGYYRTQPAIGTHGDFITAPEVTQIFGEIIGAWFLHFCEHIGTSGPIILCEMGAGRGQALLDIMRVFAMRPQHDISIHIVERNMHLRKVQ
ncbi:MAG: SAM-dependent methyltransferase, partial [Pseudomonadota bacterium]